ncbi:MAG TPA: hypothetical protein VFA46_13390 [Actinomycetes bacterium]|nr:hypothetical protein [Actinomycetes bacterium]
MRWTSAAVLATAEPLDRRGVQPPWVRVLGVAATGLAVAGILLALQFIRLAGNHQGSDPTAPFVVGTRWHLDEELAARGIHATVTNGPGYDGQWFLGLAYDPLLRERLAAGFDTPRYRARRPLFPVVGWLASAGQPAAVPVALLAVELLAVALGCAAVGRVLASYGRSRWWGLGFAFIPGVAVGVMFGTAEPLALALAALGLSLVLDGRSLAAGLAVAGAGLTKETYLGFGAAAAAWLLLRSGRAVRERLRSALVVGVPGVALLALWWWYVARMVPATPSDTSGAQAFGAPLTGWAHVLVRIAGGNYVADAPVGPFGWLAMLSMFVLLALAVVVSLRLRSLADWNGLLMGWYGLLIDGVLLSRFLSASRALAPCVLGAGLAVLAARRPRPRSREGTEAVTTTPSRWGWL